MTGHQEWGDVGPLRNTAVIVRPSAEPCQEGFLLDVSAETQLFRVAADIEMQTIDGQAWITAASAGAYLIGLGLGLGNLGRVRRAAGPTVRDRGPPRRHRMDPPATPTRSLTPSPQRYGLGMPETNERGISLPTKDEPCTCAASLTEFYKGRGIEVTTQPRHMFMQPRGEPPFEMECAHGVHLIAEPTLDQSAAWLAEQREQAEVGRAARAIQRAQG